ncbi:MAG: BlaI/MecI/CopY family transcriptional regulator [Clostridia bacterium]|nr:BlaI/MecI/CopY family transcriptional regulator [Clostridia bacterium]
MNIDSVNGLIDELKQRANPVDYSVKLPDAEFDVMSAIWAGNPPVNTAYLMKAVGNDKGWKAPTLISFLVRLEDRGFIASYKNGKERFYIAIADRDEYVHTVTENFIGQYHGGSFVAAMNSFFKDRNLSEDDIDELLEWLKSRY